MSYICNTMSQNYSIKPKIILKSKAVFRKSDKTQQSILDAALDYLWTKPYRSLTVNELMSMAGSSRSAFYRYFDDLPTMMEHLLNEFKEKIMATTGAWLNEEGDPILQLEKSLENLVRICYQYGPILRAVTDAAPANERLEKAWTNFVKNFDDAVSQRIEHQQKAGLIKPFDARPIAIALNRMNADLVRHHFGRRPRTNQISVRDAIIRVWVATLYGDSALDTCFSEKNSSTDLT
jgi:AcrR family transcriptional regulator